MIALRSDYVIPIAEPPISNGCVVVDEGTIRYVGTLAEAPLSGESVTDLGAAILMPGLVNAHTHLELTVMRGFLEDLEFRRWILRLTSAKRGVLSRDDLLDSARLGLIEGIAAGITTYADTCDSGAVFDAMIEAGVRGIMYQEVFGPDPAICDAAMGDLRAKVADLQPRQTALVRVGISPHAPYTVSDDLFRAVATYAGEADLPVAVHIAESEPESSLIIDGTGPFADGLRARSIHVAPRARTPVDLLDRHGILERSPLLIHCVRVDSDDVAAIVRSRSAVAHCPISNAKLGHGIAPILELLAAGVTIALGTDSMASNNRMDILEEMRAAVLFQRARIGSHEALTAHDALALATLEGAKAIGLADRIGSIEVGKDADLVAFPISHQVPVQDPETAAVFALGGAKASLVMVAGRILVDPGQRSTDHADLAKRVQRTAGRLRAWVEEGGELQPPPPLDFR